MDSSLNMQSSDSSYKFSASQVVNSDTDSDSSDQEDDVLYKDTFIPQTQLAFCYDFT